MCTRLSEWQLNMAYKAVGGTLLQIDVSMHNVPILLFKQDRPVMFEGFQPIYYYFLSTIKNMQNCLNAEVYCKYSCTLSLF